MYSIFFKMSEIFVNITFGILERLFGKKEEEMFKERVGLTIKLDRGFAIVQQGRRYYAEYRGKYVRFRPRFAVSDFKTLPKLTEAREPEAVYVTWRELASEKFFEDVEKMFEKLGGGKRGGS